VQRFGFLVMYKIAARFRFRYSFICQGWRLANFILLHSYSRIAAAPSCASTNKNLIAYFFKLAMA